MRVKPFATVLTARNAGMWEGIEALETMNLTIDSTIFDADQGPLEPGQKGSSHLLFDALAGLSASSYRLEYTKTPHAERRDGYRDVDCWDHLLRGAAASPASLQTRCGALVPMLCPMQGTAISFDAIRTAILLSARIDLS
ncbi:hypothetical protein ASE23_28200 [Rhizobium sp. Root73]|nr:hypothetical protein ASE23_28200 [Rhizobium sp. Root73]